MRRRGRSNQVARYTAAVLRAAILSLTMLVGCAPVVPPANPTIEAAGKRHPPEAVAAKEPALASAARATTIHLALAPLAVDAVFVLDAGLDDGALLQIGNGSKVAVETELRLLDVSLQTVHTVTWRCKLSHDLWNDLYRVTIDDVTKSKLDLPAARAECLGGTRRMVAVASLISGQPYTVRAVVRVKDVGSPRTTLAIESAPLLIP